MASRWKGLQTGRVYKLLLVQGKAEEELRNAHNRLEIKVKECTADLQGQLLEQEGFQSYYAVPLIAKGYVQGVIENFHQPP